MNLKPYSKTYRLVFGDDAETKMWVTKDSQDMCYTLSFAPETAYNVKLSEEELGLVIDFLKEVQVAE